MAGSLSVAWLGNLPRRRLRAALLYSLSLGVQSSVGQAKLRMILFLSRAEQTYLYIYIWTEVFDVIQEKYK